MVNTLNKIVSLAKRRGFIYPSSEIYGGLESSYDYGPLGVEMKNNIKQVWWKEMTKKENLVGLDSAILMSPRVWQASGHLTAGFADELVECQTCHKRFRLNEVANPKSEIRNSKQIPNSKFQTSNLKCPECGGELTKPKKFNLMMKTFVGPLEDESSQTYLRAETCQGIFVNFLNILNSQRLKIPFGVCQIGKSFRNEITTKNFIFRTREFEQMEMEWFCKPNEAGKWFNYWKDKRFKWYQNLGIKKANLRIRENPKKELPHYAKKAVDIEYKFPFGWGELEAIHNRGDWDLSTHSKHSGQDLRYYDEEKKEKYFPYVIETSGGIDRSFLAVLVDSYQEIKGGRTRTTKATKEIEILLKLDKRLAPIKVAVLPLVKNKPKLVKAAKEVYATLKPHFTCQYDELGSIGRRYRRLDEIAVPFALTVDFESLEKDDLTIRDRDSMAQERVKISDLIEVLKEKLENF